MKSNNNATKENGPTESFQVYNFKLGYFLDKLRIISDESTDSDIS